MKIFALLLVLCLWLSACGTPTAPAPTPPLPTFAPVALAQTTNAPTPTLDPRVTLTATSSPVSTATRVPPTSTPAPLQFPTVLGRIKLLDLPGEGRAPGALARLDSTLYVANRESKNLALVRDDRVAAYLPLGLTPSALVADSARNRIYAGTYETPTLFAIQNGAIVNQVAAGGRINALALKGDDLYVALDSDAVIERYDAATLVKKDELKLSHGFAVGALVVDEPRNRLYAGEYGKIVALDLSEFQELFALGVPYLYSDFAVNPADGSIWSGAYDEKASRAYVVGYAPDGKEITRAELGADLAAATFDDAGNLYLLDKYENKVYVVHTPDARLVATVPVNDLPSDAVYDAGRKLVAVSNADSDNLSLIDTAVMRVVNTIPLASRINALVANPTRRRVYAANGSTNSVFVIEDGQVVGQVKTGNNPVDLAVDTARNRLYAAASADGTLTVIDETTLEIQTTQVITRFLSTVAVDPANYKLFAGSYELNPETLAPVTTLYAQGMTIGSKTVPQYARVNPVLRKLYAIASNGVPGSNARWTLYRFLYDQLAESKMLGSRNGGNTTALDLDLTTNNVFAANTHPLAYTHGLDVFDEQDNLVQTLALGSHTPALVVNPETHHLFLAHARTFQPYPRDPAPRDNTVEILDTRTLGYVATLEVPGEPWRMARLKDQIFVAGWQDGVITVLGDVATSRPAAPTPTLTATPFPTWTPEPNVAATPTSSVGVNVQCSFGPPAPFAAYWVEHTAELGCPVSVSTTGNFAVQTFKDGYMYDDLRNPVAKKIYALYPDHTYAVFADTWQEGEEERPCNDIKIPEGRIHPKRGFGKVWCGNPVVQAKLPGAVADEAGVVLNVQEFERGVMWAGGPQGIVVLFADGTWQ